MVEGVRSEGCSLAPPTACLRRDDGECVGLSVIGHHVAHCLPGPLAPQGRGNWGLSAWKSSKSPHLSPRLLTALYSPHCPRAGRDRERTVCGDRIGWRVSRPPCRSSGRPDAFFRKARAASGVTAAFGRPGAEAPLTGSRGACAETSGVLAPWIWTAGISPLLREAGWSNPPVARHCGSGDIPAVRRSEVENSDRAGGVRPRKHCGLPAMRPGPRRRSSSLFSPRGHVAVGRVRSPQEVRYRASSPASARLCSN